MPSLAGLHPFSLILINGVTVQSKIILPRTWANRRDTGNHSVAPEPQEDTQVITKRAPTIGVLSSWSLGWNKAISMQTKR